MDITCDIYQLLRKVFELQKAQLEELKAIRQELEKLNGEK